LTTTRAIVNIGRGLLQLQELPLPQPGPGQVRIHTAACAICATDLKLISGSDRVGFPAIPGHEWSGTVDATGPDVDESLTGAFVVGENVLSDGGEVGFEHPGAYAEYFLTEASRLYEMPPSFDPAVACLIEPLAVCVHAQRRLAASIQERALIFGDGGIGLLMLALLRAAGTQKVVVIGGRRGRLRLASELGAAAVHDYRELGTPLGHAIRTLYRDGFSSVVEASGAPIALEGAFEAATPNGTVLVIGDYDYAQATFVWNDLVHRELTLVGSNASAGAWPAAISLAVSSAVPLKRLVSVVLPAVDFAHALTVIRAERDDVVKVVLDWRA